MAKKSKYGYRYSTEDLPKIKNIFLYIYGCIAKLLMYLIFGTGAILLAILAFPILRLIFHPAKKFRKNARLLVSYAFRFFIWFMHIIHGSLYKTDGRKKYASLKSKIVVANHPSILDVVYLISLIPNADCIVRGGLTKTVLAGVIRQLYIVNDSNWDDLMIQCKKSLDEGNCLIIFPEGTRTPRHGTNPFKRGAARIAYETGCNIQPVYIGGNDKYGLGKHDAIFSYNRTEPYKYDIRMLPEIAIESYKDREPQIASRAVTKKIHDSLAAEAYLSDYKII